MVPAHEQQSFSFGRGLGLGLRRYDQDHEDLTHCANHPPHDAMYVENMLGSSYSSLVNSDQHGSHAHLLRELSRSSSSMSTGNPNEATHEKSDEKQRNSNHQLAVSDLRQNMELMKADFDCGVQLINERDVELKAQDLELKVLSEHYNTLYDDMVKRKTEETEKQHIRESALNEEIRRKNEEIQALHLEMKSERNKHRDSLQRAAKEYETSMDTLQEEMRDSFERQMRQRDSDQSEQIMVLITRVKRSEADLSDKENEINALHCKLDRHQTDYHSITGELAQATEHVQSLMNQVSELKTQQTKSNARINELEKLLTKSVGEKGLLKAEVEARTIEAKTEAQAREAAEMKRDATLKKSEELVNSLRNEIARSVLENRRKSTNKTEEMSKTINVLNGEVISSHAINDKLHDIILENRAIMDQARSTIAEELDENKKNARSVLTDVFNLSQDMHRLNKWVNAQCQKLEEQRLRTAPKVNQSTMTYASTSDSNDRSLEFRERLMQNETDSRERSKVTDHIDGFQIKQYVAEIAERITRDTLKSMMYQSENMANIRIKNTQEDSQLVYDNPTSQGDFSILLQKHSKVSTEHAFTRKHTELSKSSIRGNPKLYNKSTTTKSKRPTKTSSRLKASSSFAIKVERLRKSIQ